jgi:hypothetical protein
VLVGLEAAGLEAAGLAVPGLVVAVGGTGAQLYIATEVVRTKAKLIKRCIEISKSHTRNNTKTIIKIQTIIKAVETKNNQTNNLVELRTS